MNTEYLLWFAALVVVAGAALLWLVIGGVPEIPTDPGADDPDGIGAPAPLGPEVQPPRRPAGASESAREDGLTEPA